MEKRRPTLIAIEFVLQNVRHLVVSDFSSNEMNRATEQIVKESTGVTVPIIIVPGDKNSYYTQKASFIHAGLK